MAEIYKGVERTLARNDAVQAFMDEKVFEMGVRAEELLIEHRQEGHAEIEVEKGGKVDWFLILSDERGQKAALSIEYGHGAYGVDENGNTVAPDDPEAVYVVGESEGLYILAQAAHLPKKRKGKVRF